jgi:hypothetical protein
VGDSFLGATMNEQIWTVTEVVDLKASPQQVWELPRRVGQTTPRKRPANNPELSEAVPPNQNPEHKRAANAVTNDPGKGMVTVGRPTQEGERAVSTQ